jgi:hypothetical protein
MLSTMANGVITFSLFGLAVARAGLIEFIGIGVRNEGMANIGTAVSLIFPSDALWRGASYYVQSSAFLAQTSAFGPVHRRHPVRVQPAADAAAAALDARLPGAHSGPGADGVRPARPVGRGSRRAYLVV